MSNFTIPKTQRVAYVAKEGGSIEIKEDYPVKSQKELAPGECLVKIESTGKSSVFSLSHLRTHLIE